MDLTDQIATLLADFANPKKRVFVGYLLLSLLIAFVWLFLAQRNSFKTALKRLFDRKIFWSGSAQTDYKIFFINRIFTLFISPLLLTQLAIATAIYFALHRVDFLSSGMFADTPKAVAVALFTVALFLADDFTKYLLHRWMHRWRFLWAIHKVHHSAETLTPVTVYRIHPLEGVLYACRSAVAQGSVIAPFIFLFGSSVDLYTIAGANVLVFIFHVTGSNLRHSHINIHYWPWLERILISPAQHQLHHSIAEAHHDKNFGAALAIWDWMFGSLHLSEKSKTLTFGLGPTEASATDLGDIYMRPFAEIYRITRRTLKRRWSQITGFARPGS